MRDDLSGAEFLRFVWHARRVPAIACLIAVVCAGIASLLLPKRYTATSTILIEPPAGNDPRAVTAVSTVYLESLATYERLVASDSLFKRALKESHLLDQYRGATIEELKEKILDVSKPVNTSLIEVSITLPNPAQAQRFAQTLAEDAVDLNSSLDLQSSEDLLHEPRLLLAEATARREKAEQVQMAFLQRTSVLTLDQEVNAATELRAEVNLDLARGKVSLASYEGRRSAETPEGSPADQSTWTEWQIAATSARIHDLQEQADSLTKFLDEQVPAVEKLKRQEEAIETELRAARADEESALERLKEIQSSAAIRRVRITVLDPGIVPEKPSFPNLPVNLIAAFLLALVISLGYLALRFSQVQVEQPEEKSPVFSIV